MRPLRRYVCAARAHERDSVAQNTNCFRACRGAKVSGMPITQLAEQYLAAFSAGGQEFPGGISYLEALGQCRLDYTPESLQRIDTLLDQIRTTEAPKHEVFIKDRANQNFLYFLGFYVGKTIERNNPGAQVEWLEHKELVARNPGLAKVWTYQFETLRDLRHHRRQRAAGRVPTALFHRHTALRRRG